MDLSFSGNDLKPKQILGVQGKHGLRYTKVKKG